MTLIVWTLQVNYKHSHSKDMIEYIKDISSRYQCIYLHRVWGIKKELLISITEFPWFNNLRILNQESKRRDLSRVIESEQQTLHLKSQSEIIQTGERFTLESRVKLTTISIWDRDYTWLRLSPSFLASFAFLVLLNLYKELVVMLQGHLFILALCKITNQ